MEPASPVDPPAVATSRVAVTKRSVCEFTSVMSSVPLLAAKMPVGATKRARVATPSI